MFGIDFGKFGGINLMGTQMGLNSVGGSYENLNVLGATTAEKPVTVSGTLASSGLFKGESVEAKAIEANGTFETQSIRAGTASINGTCITTSVDARAFALEGTIRAEKLQAKRADLKIDSSDVARITTIEAEELVVVVKRGELQADRISGARLKLERTKAREVYGEDVVIGDGCEVNEVLYKTSLDVAATAKVGSSRKVE